MKKSLLFFILSSFVLTFLHGTLMAQVPQLFNYQGIARDAGGNVLPNRVIGVELSVLNAGPTGTIAGAVVVYSETFTDTTNAFGLFTVQIGGGNVVSGSFGSINWATGNKYLQTAIDLTGGTNYALSGTTQLLSVPYALYAGMTAADGGWSLNGNAGTTNSNFVGTTDNQPLFFRVGDSVAGGIKLSQNDVYFGLGSGRNAIEGPVDTTSQNTAIGGLSLYTDQGGVLNTAVGFQALYRLNGGTANTGIGAQALGGNVTGGYNVAVGAQTLPGEFGSYNTAVGCQAEISPDGMTNSTAIGYHAIAIGSNMVQIGNSGVTTIQGQVPFTTPSDGRFKFNIREDVKGLDFILKLRPVTYQFNTKKEEDFMRGVKDSAGVVPVEFNEAMMVRRTGFIAQEVEKAARQSGYDFDGIRVPKTDKEYYSLSYASFVVPLVKAVQEQEETIEELRKEVKELKQLIEQNKSSKP
jgi:hypothetical protein